MKTQTNDTSVQQAETLKTWSAPRLEVLTVALDTLVADPAGSADGAGTAANTKT
jgi:hypothetical protein